MVEGNRRGEWKFVPIDIQRNDDRWFELEFSLPQQIAELVSNRWGDQAAIADIKQEHFSYIDLSGMIGGIRRNIRLELDRNWIGTYVARRTSGNALLPAST
jgi:hypothetical protein